MKAAIAISQTRERLNRESAYRLGQWITGFFGGLVMLLIGSMVLAVGVSEAGPQPVIYSAFVFGLGLAGLIFLSLELRLTFRRLGPSAGTAPNGRAATIVHRVRWHMPQLVTVNVLLAGTPLASGIAFLFDNDNAAAAVFMLPLGLWLASYFVPILRGQVHGGGVYLTPEGIHYVKHGGWWRAGWDDILAATRREPVRVVFESGRAGERGRTSLWGWKGEVNTGTPQVFGIETRHLTVGPTAIAEVINLCKLNPEFRTQLGTPAALEWPQWKLDATSPAPETPR